MMLQDLADVLQQVRDRTNKIPLGVPFRPSKELWDEVHECYEQASGDAVSVVGDALVLLTPTGNFLAISAQEIPRIWAVIPYVEAIAPYESAVDKLAQKLGYASRSAAGAKEVFKLLPGREWRNAIDKETVQKIDAVISNELGLQEQERKHFLRFLEDRGWSGVGKTLERGDWRTSAVVGAGGWLAAAADRRGQLADALSRSTSFERLMEAAVNEAVDQAETEIASIVRPTGAGKNLVFYGAPGTGKSYGVSKMIGGQVSIRTVFHPDTQNSDFFGSLKPSMQDGSVTYGFAPGPMARALLNAHKDHVHHHFLVIEELNRAPAAAVFGELFQLLDRGNDGQSNYAVDFPTPESKAWFKSQGYSSDRLILPSNLTIIATMNSADQGVHPLDTAFRRRWEQKYMPLAEGEGPNGDVSFVDRSGAVRRIAWKPFVTTLNAQLLDAIKVAEDRLFGLWFLKESELGEGIPDKILLYLLDDLLRHEGREAVFVSGVQSYGQLAERLGRGAKILSDSLLERLEERAHPSEKIPLAQDEHGVPE